MFGFSIGASKIDLGEFTESNGHVCYFMPSFLDENTVLEVEPIIISITVVHSALLLLEPVNRHIQYSYLIIALTCVETILFISFCFDFQDVLRISTHKEHIPYCRRIIRTSKRIFAMTKFQLNHVNHQIHY
jgi:hypothetical protein